LNHVPSPEHLRVVELNHVPSPEHTLEAVPLS
jgi:hypothetical protein